MERRNTKQRQIILDAVQSRCDHPTADQIYEQVHKSNNKISVGTVYRNLDILAKEGKILDINLPEADHYDLRVDNHNHFICEKCGKVFDISVEYDESLDHKKTKEGFVVNSHQMVFKGLCPKCNKNN